MYLAGFTAAAEMQNQECRAEQFQSPVGLQQLLVAIVENCKLLQSSAALTVFEK